MTTLADSGIEVQTSSRKWWAMLGIGLGVLMATLDAGIVNISLPTLVEQLNTNFVTVQWVVLSYVLVVTSLMLSAGRLGDMLGKKKLYVFGLVMFTIGSLLCGISSNVGWLIGFRAIQGVGAAVMQALGIAIVTEAFPSTERGRALGVMGSIIFIGVALGPPIGGILIGKVGWRSVFLVNLPIGIIATLVVSRFISSQKSDMGSEHFDTAGAFALMITLICYALGMTLVQLWGLRNLYTLALLGTAVLGLAGFLLIESRVNQPMIDLRLFQNVPFSLNLLMSSLVAIVLAGVFILPFFLELVKEYPTELIGLLLMVVPLSVGLVAPIAGAISDRLGPRPISLAGLLIIVAGCITTSTLQAEVTPLGFVLRLLPVGIGIGIFQSPNNSAIMGISSPENLGITSGLLSLSRTLGQTTGLPLMGALFTAQITSNGNLTVGIDVASVPSPILVASVNDTYRVAAFIVLVATILAAIALWVDHWQHKSIVE